MRTERDLLFVVLARSLALSRRFDSCDGEYRPHSRFFLLAGHTYLQEKKKEGSPGFPVEFGGVGELHAAFLTESRTGGHIRCSVQEIRFAHLVLTHVRESPRTWDTRPEGKACEEEKRFVAKPAYRRLPRLGRQAEGSAVSLSAWRFSQPEMPVMILSNNWKPAR